MIAVCLEFLNSQKLDYGKNSKVEIYILKNI